jgi:hypothetical protein
VLIHDGSFPYVYLAYISPLVPHGNGLDVGFGVADTGGVALMTGVAGTQLLSREALRSWQPETSHVSIEYVAILGYVVVLVLRYKYIELLKPGGTSVITHLKLYRYPEIIGFAARNKSLAVVLSTTTSQIKPSSTVKRDAALLPLIRHNSNSCDPVILQRYEPAMPITSPELVLT